MRLGGRLALDPPRECPRCGGPIYVTGQKPFFDLKPAREGGPRFAALVGPAQIGKTHTGAAKLLSYALQYPAQYFVGAPIFHQHMKLATLPKYESLLESALDRVDLTDDGRIFHKTDSCIRLKPSIAGKRGSTIHFRSVDEPGKMWGGVYGGFHLDEAGQMEEEVTIILEARLTDPEGPRQGLYTFTPRGDRRHWTYRYFGSQYEKALALAMDWRTGWVESGDYPVATLTIEQNPWYDEQARRDRKMKADAAGGLAAQEYYGLWYESGGLVYPEFDPNLHARYLPKDAVIRRVAAGVDWGISAPTVIIVAGEDDLGRLWWLHEFYKPNCDWREFIQECNRLRMLYPAICFYCDPAGYGGPHKQNHEIGIMRMVHGFRAYPADNSVERRVHEIRGRLSRDGSSLPGMFVTPECDHSIAEFLSWSFKEGKGLSGTVIYDEVEPHAHCMDAGGYATLALCTSRNEPIRVEWGTRREKVRL